MVWNRLVLSLLLVVPAASQGQCDEGTCQSLQPYFSCEVEFGKGAAGAGNTITFAHCPGIGDIVVRLRLVGSAHSGKYVHAWHVLQQHIVDGELLLIGSHFDQLPAEDSFLEMAFLSGLTSALESRPIRPIHRKGEGQAELLWREKIRWSMAWVFDIAGPAASCTYCFNDTVLVPFLPVCVRHPGDELGQCLLENNMPPPFELEVEVMPRARPIGASIPGMSISELLVLLTGYTMDLHKMALLGFLHDNHLGNLLLVTSLTGEKKMAWHDFGAQSYFGMTTQPQFESFRKLFDESYAVVIESLTRHNGTVGLVAQLNQIKSERSLEGAGNVDGVSRALATLAEGFQQAIMQWAEGSIATRRSVLQAWSRALPPARVEALRELLEQGRTKPVWVRQLREAGQTFNESLPAFKITVPVTDVDDLKKAIKKEELLKIPASKILIFSRDKDGQWQQLTDIAAEVAENEVTNPYGFVIPSPPAKAPASAVTWVRQLVFDEENDRYEIADAQAFPITERVAIVALLKTAIKQEKPSIDCDADQILINSRDKDGKWKQEEEDAEVKRGATKSDSYGFVLPDASQPGHSRATLQTQGLPLS